MSWHDEWEPSTNAGQPARVRTLFLRGSECRFRCLMCDLWKYTHTEATSPGDISRQVQQGITAAGPENGPRCSWLKLYNASSFFDTKNIPSSDLPAIADQVRIGFERVIVENHPRLLPMDVVERFQRAIHPARLEIAMGLETVEPTVLERLNKQMTVDDFRRAAAACRLIDVDVRTFVLLQPPWMSVADAVLWCQRSIDLAIECGARLVSVIPVRGGNGAMERLAESGEFTPPTARSLENILYDNLSIKRSEAQDGQRSQSNRSEAIVTVDLWDWDKLRGVCASCSSARHERLERMNLTRTVVPEVKCLCDAHVS
ncbi:MAG: radical SAM protein [Pirellulaceae bacterium]|nr:radical SAM protein [Pirellulaceae bacterium]